MKEKFIKVISTVKLVAKRHTPELLLGGALIAGTATVITACKANTKAKNLKEEFENEQHMINRILNDPEKNITEEESEQMCKKASITYGLNLVKTYSVPTVLYVTTIACVFASYKIQKNRQVALSSALLATSTAYNTLMDRLKEGAAAGLTAKEVMNGVRVKEVVNDETGEISYEKYIAKIEGPVQVRFDRSCLTWTKDKFQNESTLRCEGYHLNDKLRLDGYVFLNDVYERLGMPKTKEGQILGWMYDDNAYIDLGIVDCAELDGPEYDDNAFELTINVQGDILTKFK